MEKETIKRFILDSREIMAKTSGHARELGVDHGFLTATGKIAAIIGPRRAGKSVFLRQMGAQTATLPEKTVWIDFSEIVWADFGPEDWATLWQAALELGCGEKPLFLLDEIQEVRDFAAGLRHLQNQGCRLYVTGSNSTVFGAGLASMLRGKVICYSLFPLSFSEFLTFKGASFPADLSTSQRAARHVLWEEYLSWGGFPEVVLADREDLKRNLLDSYLDIMLFRDVIERHALKNFALVEKLFTKLLLSFTKEISVHRWYQDFRSQGMQVGKDTLYQYLAHFEEALFVRLVGNAAAPGGNKKVYLVDNGLYQRVRDRPDWGKLWENHCLVDLWRHQQSVSFWKNDQGEIDFVTDTELIQATVELTPGNHQRETTPFLAVASRFPRHQPVVREFEKS
jgi:predicted AAA+ superfamily ATPase